MWSHRQGFVRLHSRDITEQPARLFCCFRIREEEYDPRVTISQEICRSFWAIHAANGGEGLNAKQHGTIKLPALHQQTFKARQSLQAAYFVKDEPGARTSLV